MYHENYYCPEKDAETAIAEQNARLHALNVKTAIQLGIKLFALCVLLLPNTAMSKELEAGEPVTIGVYAEVNNDMMLDGVCYHEGEAFDCEDAGIEFIPSEDTRPEPLEPDAPSPQE